jgi:hypothetical protein
VNYDDIPSEKEKMEKTLAKWTDQK